MKWEIEYDNDTGPTDECFCEWWIVTDKEHRFKCDTKVDAEWLCGILNVIIPLKEY